MKLEVFDKQLSWHREVSTELLHPVSVEEMQHEAEPSALDIGTESVGGNQSKEAPRASEDVAGPGVEDTHPSDRVNKGEAHGPTTGAELVACPQASPSKMALVTLTGP